ncbi:hypothetical protein QQS21_000126 [Conoideocrella luteorostrata]|uniref:HET-domain-containing protein n=1 Tax=Conoideocrella luteorostrata TaxID=1105319 RepID=A0AAJ0G2T8_9HYPO|nr:hypothetical protein QQS21_000126 [Conoideocrella luteorostrata]
MKLFDIQTRIVVEFRDSDIPPYAVLSYTCHAQLSPPSPSQNANATNRSGRLSPTHQRLIEACEKAERRGIAHLWVFSLCVDVSSSADLDEAVNGSLRRLRRSSVCIVQLDDLSATGQPFDESLWRRSQYWSRAWTLQELILPPNVEFFDEKWNHRGSRTSPEILPLLCRITRVPTSVLRDSTALSHVSLAVRISWSAHRVASREEDTAYSLAAITGVTLPVRYGEGAERAFLRLQREILQDTRDGSLLAWRSSSDQHVRGLLARSPSEFRHFAANSDAACSKPWTFDGRVRFSNKGIQVESRISRQGSYILLDIGKMTSEQGFSGRLAIYLREWNGIYVRVHPSTDVSISGAGRRVKIDVAQDLDSKLAFKIHAAMAASETQSQLSIRFSGLPQDLIEDNSKILSDSEDDSDSSEDSFSRSSSSSSNEYDDDDDEEEEEEEEEEGFDNKYENALRVKSVAHACHLDESHAFQSVRRDITNFAYGQIEVWIASARYVVPPEDILPRRKRARTSRSQPMPQYLEEEHAEDPQMLTISRIDGYLHLACPFYVSNPDKYSSCLLHYDLISVDDVIDHIRRDHRQPPYCPICCRVFQKAAERDDHVRARRCETCSSGVVDGISEHQRTRLASRDRPYYTERQRWLMAWVIVFPDVALPNSPYLEDGIGRAISMVWDHWAGYGMGWVSEFLISRELLQQACSKQKRALTALCTVILRDLLIKVFNNYGMLNQKNGIGEC